VTTPRVRRRATALVAAALVATTLAIPAAAQAVVITSPAGDAQERARALRVQVDRLRTEAEQATEAYDAAYDELGRVVTAHLSEQQALDAAVAASAGRRKTADLRVRALYMSGGAPALYATVLQGTDIGDVLSRLQSVRRVVGADRTTARLAGRVVAERSGGERRLAELAARQTRLQQDVAGRGDAVRALLAQTDALLAAADERLRALAEEQRRAAEAAAAQSAAAQLALALQGTDPPAPPPSEAAGRAVAAALSQLGKPYLWGGTGPGAFDCSGLTQSAYRAAGITLPRVASQQWSAGRRVALGDLQPGDLLFWAFDPVNPVDPASIHHVALYLGNGRMVVAPHAGAQVRVQPLYLEGYVGAVRPAVTGP
jgi:cell wall-associated NlpC family hydrolase